MTRRLVLGTAGHIDHGKTALVRELTGVDTDRLREEKERGITVDLGFAELAVGERVAFGVVDVPGHEGFIRNMVAGATGMDVVLLVVAADEGVMPQTREHLAIVELLGVEELVVALTKVDRVEEAWLELVRDEVRETLDGGPFADAPVVATSATRGDGLDELTRVLDQVGRRTRNRSERDLARLPVDRVFTVRGTGTVVTGTLWSGALEVEDEVRVLPAKVGARVRELQVHGESVDRAVAGQRTAVALAGGGAEPGALGRGETVVRDPGWTEAFMLTVRASVLEGPGWPLEHNQRVRVHLGTSEVMARVAALEGELGPGEEGWIQLRLEAPVVARARDRLILRSYSPVTTIAGARVAEPHPPKRTRLDGRRKALLSDILGGSPARSLDGVLTLSSWSGVGREDLPVATGSSPAALDELLAGSGHLRAGGRLYSEEVRCDARERLMTAVEACHRREPLRPGMALELLRQELPGPEPETLADAVLNELVEDGRIRVDEGWAARVDFRPEPDPEQEEALDRLRELYRGAGLSPPAADRLPGDLAERDDLWALLRHLERGGEIVSLSDEFFAWQPAVEEAACKVREGLGGRKELGPVDFRQVLSLSRKHLIPLLNHFDETGVTVRGPGGREVLPG